MRMTKTMAKREDAPEKRKLCSIDKVAHSVDCDFAYKDERERVRQSRLDRRQDKKVLKIMDTLLFTAGGFDAF